MVSVSILYVRPYSMALPVLSAASKNFMSEVTFTLIFAKALAWQFEALLTGDIICFFLL